MDNEPHRYAAIIEMGSDSTMQRISTDVPLILDVMRRLSTGDLVTAFRSKDGLLFGVFICSKAKPEMIRAEFEKSDGSRNGDHIMVFDVGDRHAGTSGFSRAWTWLQRH